MRFAVFNADGSIDRIVECRKEDSRIQCGNNESIIKAKIGVNCKDYYVDTNALKIEKKREINGDIDKLVINSDGKDSVVINNMPVPCKVSVSNITYFVDDGVIEFTANLPDRYTLRIESVQYLPFEIVVDAI